MPADGFEDLRPDRSYGIERRGRFLKDERSITIDTAEKILTALGCTAEIKRPKPKGAPLVMVQQKKRKGTKKRK